MSLLNTTESIKITDVNFISWEKSNVLVSPRPFHALVFRAKGEAIFNKSSDNPIISKEGNVSLMPANCGYSAEYPVRNEIFVIHFTTDEAFEPINYEIVSSKSIMNLFKNAYTLWNDSGPAYYHKTMSLFYEILSEISDQADVFYKSDVYKDFFRAVDYMKKNFPDSSLTIEKLSKMANMSSTYFRKLFTQRIGETPAKHLVSLRLKYAEQLLAKGDYSINQVAEMAGFNDVKYFSRVVKKVYGYPPSKLYK